VERGLEAAGRRDANRLGALVAGMTCFGTVMVLFASPVTSIADFGSPFSLFERQVLWVVLGLVGYALAVRLDLRLVRRLARPALIGAILLLLLVLVPHLGKTAYGSSRWIGAGPFHLQPSELSKLCFALFCADLVARRRHARDQWREVVRPLAIVMAVACILILKQPDLGTAIVVACVALSVLYAGGIHRRLVVGFAAVLGIGGGILALSASYRRARLLAFINPFAHASTTGYQVVQSLASLGSGHLAGTGGTAALAPWFLPNADTDFIFAVIGNDLGLVGGVLVVAGFLVLGLLGVRIALRTVDPFARLLVTSITCWIVLQALVNIGGVIGALPDTGIPLPFLSYGGSSLIVVLFATGLVVHIGRNPRLDTESVRQPRSGRAGGAAQPSRRPSAVHPSRRPVAVHRAAGRPGATQPISRRPRATAPPAGARRRVAGGGGR
jgi:cell division protein FtsW